MSSDIIKVPGKAFQALAKNTPGALRKLVQSITVKLQRISFMALHIYMGLSAELISVPSREKRALARCVEAHQEAHGTITAENYQNEQLLASAFQEFLDFLKISTDVPLKHKDVRLDYSKSIISTVLVEEVWVV